MSISTKDIAKARRTAKQIKWWARCATCTIYNKKCDPSRPCTRCVSQKRNCVKTDNSQSSQQVVQNVERPLQSNMMVTVNDIISLSNPFPHGNSWVVNSVQMELVRFQAMGANTADLSRLLASMSLDDRFSAIPMAIQDAASLGLRFPASETRTRGIAALEHSVDLNSVDPFCCVAIDPVSCQRKSVLVNMKHAAFLGMHPEEFLARAASHQMPEWLAAIDASSFLFYKIITAQFRGLSLNELFLRFYVSFRREKRTPILVRARRVEVTDCDGRVVQVHFLPALASKIMHDHPY